MYRTYTEAVRDMSDRDAVRFLLDVLDRDMIRFNQRKCDVLAHLGNPHIQRKPLALLIALWDNRGRVMTYDSLCTVIELEDAKMSINQFMTHDLVSPTKRLRRTIREYGWPLEINVVYGLGYRLDLLDPEWTIEPAIQTGGE